MIALGLVLVLLADIPSEAKPLGFDPAEAVKTALENINKYLSESRYSTIGFDNFKYNGFLYDFSVEDVKIGDLSTFEFVPKSLPNITSNISDKGTTYFYQVELDLKKGFLVYEYVVRLLHIFEIVGKATATSGQSFTVEGTVSIDAAKNCQANIWTMDIKVGHFKVSLEQRSLFRPVIQYLTNVFHSNIIPVETKIQYYLKDSIPKSQFSQIVCNSFSA